MKPFEKSRFPIRFFTLCLLFAAACIFAACGDSEETAPPAECPDAGWPDDVASDDTGGEEPDPFPSHVSRAVVGALESPGVNAWKGRVWDITADATLADDWTLETPPSHTWGGWAASFDVVEPCDAGDSDCDPDFELRTCSSDDDCADGGTCTTLQSTVSSPGDSPRTLCAGKSHHTYEALYDLITDAEELVDVTSLYPPNGPFEAALRNAITYLSHRDEPPQIRLQFGAIILDEFDVDEVLDTLSRDLPSADAIPIAVGTWREGFDSWNHTKIAAADGRRAIVGGMNLSAGTYLRENPVFDLSMEVSGPPATSAQAFAEELWRYTCNAQFVGETGVVDYDLSPASSTCPDDLVAHLPAPDESGDVWIASLGRMGDIGINAGDLAILAALDAAQESIKLSQQDLGPLQLGPIESMPWPNDIFDALARAMTRGVSVDIIMTTPVTNGGGSGDDLPYSNGWTERDAINRIEERLLISDEWLPDGQTASQVLCDNLRITAIQPFQDSSWPDDSEFANHAKSFIVDDRAFYIGSHNFYPADLAEFGYLVDDEAATQTLLDTYWTPLWQSSSPNIDDAC